MNNTHVSATDTQKAAYAAKSDAELHADFAIWQWAFKTGGVPDKYTDGYNEPATNIANKHLKSAECEFDYVRSEVPTFGRFQSWAGSLGGPETVDAIIGRVRCRCGEVDTKWEIGAEEPPMSLSQIIMTVNKMNGH